MEHSIKIWIVILPDDSTSKFILSFLASLFKFSIFQSLRRVSALSVERHKISHVKYLTLLHVMAIFFL